MWRVLALAAMLAVGLARPNMAAGQADATTRPAGGWVPDTSSSNPIVARATPSLVAVRFTLNSDFGKLTFIGPGIVVRPDGLVMIPLVMVDERFPDSQMIDFKIIRTNYPHDPVVVDAVFQGRDERTNMAFVKARDPAGWTAIKFQDSPPKIGDTIWSVGLLPQQDGYAPYLMHAMVSSNLRGELPQVLANDGLCAVGWPVFNADGQAIGVVHNQFDQHYLLNDNEAAAMSSALYLPPRMFMPTRGFAMSLSDPPDPNRPLRIPWTGIAQFVGIGADEAAFFNLENQSVVRITDVVAGSAADKAGLKAGQIIVRVNGQPLDRGDLPAEIAQIFQRRITQMKVGDPITLTILPERGQPLKDVTLTLEESPKGPNTAQRYYAQDIGLVVRDVTFLDNYLRKRPADATGVVVANIRDSSSPTNRFAIGDLITQMNGAPVTTLDGFRQAYTTFRKAHAGDPIVLVAHHLKDMRNESISIMPVAPPATLTPGASLFPSLPALPATAP
jgi:S1-C subfamily serine protease